MKKYFDLLDRVAVNRFAAGVWAGQEDWEDRGLELDIEYEQLKELAKNVDVIYVVNKCVYDSCHIDIFANYQMAKDDRDEFMEEATTVGGMAYIDTYIHEHGKYRKD